MGSAGGLGSVLAAGALLTLIGGGAGLAVGFVAARQSTPALDGSAVLPPAPDVSAAQVSNPLADDSTPVASARLRPVPVPVILTSLASPPGHWIRLEAMALVDHDATDAAELLADRVGEQILTYLRTVDLRQIQSPSGFLGFRRDLNDIVRSLSNDQVRGVLVHGLVVE